MTLKRAHKECEAIWKWLSENSNENWDDIKNKEHAFRELGMTHCLDYLQLCPYCEYSLPKSLNRLDEFTCGKCPIVKRYGKICTQIGYEEYDADTTKENAKLFYDKIKNL